ncbi:MAG: hypothetical protein JSV43_06300 [Methanobacteriota archaeon]|nr:MAG: hypothetical protein JSV43_06300 [Euryarchaeota archaeon]
MNVQESRSFTDNNPDAASYADGPFPTLQDNGAPEGVSIGFHDPPYGFNYVSDIMDFNGIGILNPTSGGGDFVAGDAFESLIGDQNGNGIMEWVAFYFYIPWMKDGMDNDGDGCVDEKFFFGVPGDCDQLPDAVVVYETGGSPQIGGDDGTLLTNVDWYSDIDAIEIYRAFVSPKWGAYRVRGLTYYPQIAGEFISYHAQEMVNGVNANPEMDRDQNDWYVGNIDARGFPGRPPVNHVCSAGFQYDTGVTFMRDDGWVVTSFNLVESFDDHDWNGDGDKIDFVTAYYATNPVTGDCRCNTVNTAVVGAIPKNTGTVLMPAYTYEHSDKRDWDQDGYRYEYIQLYHEIDSTWNLKGPVYTSVTFTAPVPRWGFGWWGVASDYYAYESFPLKSGGVYSRYIAFKGYRTYLFLTSDEDGNRHTKLPQYYVTYGQPAQTLGGECVDIFVREYHLNYEGIVLIAGRADGNGDGDTSDTLHCIYCPAKTGGGGNFVVEPTSKYAKGMYRDSYPYIWLGWVVSGAELVNGTVTIPVVRTEYELHEDCNVDGSIDMTYCNSYYQIRLS